MAKKTMRELVISKIRKAFPGGVDLDIYYGVKSKDLETMTNEQLVDLLIQTAADDC